MNKKMERVLFFSIISFCVSVHGSDAEAIETLAKRSFTRPDEHCLSKHSSFVFLRICPTCGGCVCNQCKRRRRDTAQWEGENDLLGRSGLSDRVKRLEEKTAVFRQEVYRHREVYDDTLTEESDDKFKRWGEERKKDRQRRPQTVPRQGRRLRREYGEKRDTPPSYEQLEREEVF